MTRVKRGHIRRKRRQRKFKIVQGTASSILLKKANQQYLKAYQNAFIDRRLRKRYFRSIWICRINAKLRQFGFNYHSLSQKFQGLCSAQRAQVLGFPSSSSPLEKGAARGVPSPQKGKLSSGEPGGGPPCFPLSPIGPQAQGHSSGSLGSVSSLENLRYFNRKIIAQLLLHDFSLFNNLNIELRSNK